MLSFVSSARLAFKPAGKESTMTKSVSYGHNGTAVGGVSALTFAIPPLNYSADFRKVEDGPGKLIMTDLTSPQDQPFTLRIAQSSKANVYAGSSLDPSVFLPNKRGTDTIIEVRAVGAEVDSTDSTYLKMFPVRVAITLSLPDAVQITPAGVSSLIGHAVAGLYGQGDATNTEGIAALLRGVVDRA